MAEIAIIGAGNVGAALGKGWAKAGHSIVFGVRDPSNYKYGEVSAAANHAQISSVSDAIANSKVIVLAVPWSAVPDTLSSCRDYQGQIIIDATNPLNFRDGELSLAIGFSTSGGEEVAKLAKGASVFKAMNQVGFAVMPDTDGYKARPVMFVAGDDAHKKPEVLKLIADLGFDARDAGPLSSARLLEPYAMLWIEQTLKHNSPANNAFGFLRKGDIGGTVEYVRYQLTDHEPQEFIAAYKEAGKHLAEAPECTGFQLAQCAEDPASLILRINWESEEAHMNGFRKGPHFPPFLKLIGPFIKEIAEMRHYTPTEVEWVK